jgi:hypothetical protein
MVTMPALDLDLVRTLVLIAEEKNFTRAAERVGRTQSAVSLQVQRLGAHRASCWGLSGPFPRLPLKARFPPIVFSNVLVALRAAALQVGKNPP